MRAQALHPARRGHAQPAHRLPLQVAHGHRGALGERRERRQRGGPPPHPDGRRGQERRPGPVHQGHPALRGMEHDHPLVVHH
eukprot:5352115-Alexandrium_andersonii.AAC.1